MRIVSQNIWHGGGDRVEGLAPRRGEFDPEVLLLRAVVSSPLRGYCRMIVDRSLGAYAPS
jgi:hypothetical protein